MPPLAFSAFDCDNHYYEPLDAFTRHIDPGFKKRAMQWSQIDGRTYLIVGGRLNRFIPNPTFDPVAKPGSLDEYFRGRNPKRQSVVELFGDLEPIERRPEYRDREARLNLMDVQGLQGIVLLPTLAVGMEQALRHDPPAQVAAIRAFNRWLQDDWGFAHRERIFGAPLFTLTDPGEAIAEVEWALNQDARFLLLLPGPVMTPSGGRSPADAIYDGFWARINEAGATVVLHGGDSHYTSYLADWGESGELQGFRPSPFRALASPNAIQDHMASTLVRGLFHRFPNLRTAAIETGSDWVFQLLAKLKKSYGQTPDEYPEDPRDTFRRHVWVSPFYEDDIGALRDLIGSDRILMGSDFPHAEGLAEPVSYIKDLKNFGFSDGDCRLIMRDNGLELSKREPA